jgi:hypothetical protein
MCLASLSIDFGDKTATAYFSHVPDQALLFTNGNKIIIDAITIWFNKNITTQSFQSFDIDTAAGVEELNKTSNKTLINTMNFTFKKKAIKIICLLKENNITFRCLIM